MNNAMFFNYHLYKELKNLAGIMKKEERYLVKKCVVSDTDPVKK